jgi:hypothetical protein
MQREVDVWKIKSAENVEDALRHFKSDFEHCFPVQSKDCLAFIQKKDRVNYGAKGNEL